MSEFEIFALFILTFIVFQYVALKELRKLDRDKYIEIGGPLVSLGLQPWTITRYFLLFQWLSLKNRNVENSITFLTISAVDWICIFYTVKFFVEL